ncbi:MFS transporter [Alteromonas sp. 009811495]|uniref:MFS transporter n=1 Tax=Alteromonas sp. 009811495 TaxID=3002962 RepID=UPI00237E9CD4|nr:MFS transporter [Alteromonas sp. 009811495]WDT86348.1 MFS transporter [Alteromonas sp. 009811495]
MSTRQTNLLRYLLAAIPARVVTGGAAVATILLARSAEMDGKTAGLLVACLTAPHVLGPLYGRWLDSATDPRRIIAGACCLFAISFQVAVSGFEANSLIPTIVALLICGTCSAFMMGGLSTQVVKLVGDDLGEKRKAQSWDTFTYGLGLTLGPFVTALFTELYAIPISVRIVMSVALFAGVLTLFIPIKRSHDKSVAIQAQSIASVIAMLRQSGPLKRTLLMTSGASFSLAALPVLAVYLSESWMQGAENGAYLVTAYGVGCLCGALILMLRPLRSEALLLLRNVGAILLVALMLTALCVSFTAGLIAYWWCGVVNAIFFAVTLAARSDYAPKQGAAQIYMWVAAAKISFASLGAFTAGLLVDIALKLPLITSMGTLALSLLLCFALPRQNSSVCKPKGVHSSEN